MYIGVFKGEKAEKQKVRVLILGESHHYETESTKKTVDGYLEKCKKEGHGEKCHDFFDQIVRSFGKDPKTERDEFWNSVWFGNYIDKICGVGDLQAVKLLSNPADRRTYNDDLFKFVNDNQIDIMFCFSRRVYKSLPSLAKHTGEYEKIVKRDIFLRKKDGTPKKDYISHCVYLPGLSHKHTTVCLCKPLDVYGMLHPSGRYGFDPENYSEKLKELINI